MSSDRPVTELAVTADESVTVNDELATVIVADVVLRFVVPLRKDNDAVFALHAAATPEKVTAVT